MEEHRYYFRHLTRTPHELSSFGVTTSKLKSTDDIHNFINLTNKDHNRLENIQFYNFHISYDDEYVLFL